MTILIPSDVDPREDASGAERMLVEEAGRLAVRGHRVTVLTRTQGACGAERGHENDFDVVRLAVPTGRGSVL